MKNNQSSSPSASPPIDNRESPHKSHSLRPTSAPNHRPKSSEFPHRVRKAMVRNPDHAPWDNSTYNVDREHLLILQDNKISKYRDTIVSGEPPSLSSTPQTIKAGATHEDDRKTITSSYSRCRDARTSGPILNVESHHIGFTQKTLERVRESTSTGIHGTQWNVSTKDRDDEPRAKPNLSIDSKSSEKFHEVFYSSDVRRAVTSRGVIVPTHSSSLSSPSPSPSSPRSSGQRRELTWDDVQKETVTSQRAVSIGPQITRQQNQQPSHHQPLQPQPQSQHTQRRRV
jgi:hypothetical protein